MSSKRNSATPLRTRRMGQKMTAQEREQAKKKFLDVFGKTANVLAACQSAGIDRSTVYRWKEVDDTFLVQFNLASEDANDRIRAELFRRAVQGVEKPVVSMGKVVYTTDEKNKPKPLMERVYSDSLLALLAKARMPEFREKQQMELSGPDGGPIQVQHLHNLTEDELDTLEMLAKQAKERSINGR